MIVRIQTPQGMKRINCEPTDTISVLYQKVKEIFPSDSWYLSNERTGKSKLQIADSKCQIKSFENGVIFYLINTETNQNRGGGEKSTSALNEDPVDLYLNKVDGNIKRKPDPNFCRHPDNALCFHCTPLEPGDPKYLEMSVPPAKFLPFHAYIRKMKKSSKFIILEDINCDVKANCTYHPPWPEGICTKCQPPPITLNLQEYRHVDNVEFENPNIVNGFLDYWRKSGCQRAGILIGSYRHHDSVETNPLAIKCSVAAIYEVRQTSSSKTIKFEDDLKDCIPKTTLEMLRAIGLGPVGWIFTDLVSKNPVEGSVKHYRGTVDTYFLTAQECITAATFQNLYPNICKYSSKGYFGSKFVTVVVTGNADNEIGFEAYQVSNQAMALARSNIIVPTLDAPELGFIRETTKEKFVPEVFYSCKDEYGNKVTRVGRPLPMEYLLIDIPVAFPRVPRYSFPESTLGKACFPIENRELLGNIQSIESLSKSIREAKKANLSEEQIFLQLIADFHFIAWLISASGLLDSPQDRGNLELAVSQLIDKSDHAPLIKWTEESPGWKNIQEMLNVYGANEGAGEEMSESHSASTETWPCSFCTFLNSVSVANCEMCGLPKSG